MKIVLVSMDCVRPDYLTHQSFQNFINNGYVFKNCISCASHTSTSHTSILTGQYPFTHGVRWLIKFKVKTKMIQEYLKSYNYSTTAFIGGFPLTAGNLNRGFDVFDYNPTVNDTKEGRSEYTPANEIIDHAIKYLEKYSNKDIFMFLHLFDAHLTLRAEFLEKTPAKDENGRYLDVEKYIGRRKRRYQEEIDFIGVQLQRLVKSTNVDLLIITSDHGEKMEGEQNYPWVINSRGNLVGSHFHEAELYNIQLKVPLIFYGSEVPKRNAFSISRNIDIMPTILSFAKININEKVDGTSLINEPKKLYAYSETYFAQMNPKNVHAYEMSKKYKWGWSGLDNLVSIQNSDWKLICTANEKLEPYLMFKVDSDETENLLQAFPKEAKELFHQLHDLLKNDNQYKITSPQFNKIKKAVNKLKINKRI